MPMLLVSPLFSIIIPTFNVESKLAASLDSILGQQNANWEILIMDGASTDGTLEIARHLAARDARVQVWSAPDAGVYDAMNKGVARAQGEFVYFLGAGDKMRAGVLDQVAAQLPPRGDRLRYVYGQMWVPEGYAYDGPFTVSKLRLENIGHQAIFFEREIFDLLGGYDLRYPHFSDYVFNFKCWGDKRIKPHYLDLIIADYEGDGISARGDENFRTDRDELVRKYLGLRQYLTMKASHVIPPGVRQKIREAPLHWRRRKKMGDIITAFTLVVPTFNGGRLLRACLESVLAQTYPHFDVLILDDGSTDGSLAWLQNLNDARVRLHRSDHVGIVANWNRALELPKQQFMGFLGQDDALDANYLQTMAELIEQHPDATLYHAGFRFVDAGNREVKVTQPAPALETGADWLRAHFRGARATWGAGYLWRSADFERGGGVPRFPRLLFADDALWLGLMENGFKASAPDVCFSIRLHTHSTGRAAPWEDWLGALELYLPFLQAMAARDAEFGRALGEVGPEYFLGQCRDFYLLSLAQFAKRGGAPPGAALEPLCAALNQIAPTKVAELRAFAASAACRKRVFIAANPLARGAYRAYLLLRYREWRGQPLAR